MNLSALVKAFGLVVVVSLAACLAPDPSRRVVLVGAAASLRAVVPELIAEFRATSPNVQISATFAGSGSLRRQVDAGAPIDLVLLAAPDPLDVLIRDGLVSADSRREVASNRLVLVGAKPDESLTFLSLDRLGSDARLAIGDPASVPIGIYAKQALTALGIWEDLQPRIVPAADVSAVLAYARRGEVDAAIVYATDVRGIDDVVQLDLAKGDWAPRPRVVAGLVPGGRGDRTAASAFLDFVSSPAGGSIWAEFGFGAP